MSNHCENWLRITKVTIDLEARYTVKLNQFTPNHISCIETGLQPTCITTCFDMEPNCYIRTIRLLSICIISASQYANLWINIK